jgi:uncharacterized protein (TIGR02145 family)
MERASLVFTVSAVFMFLFSYGNLSDKTGYPAGLNSFQTTTKSVQTQTKPAQTTTKSVQTQTKPAQTTTKSVQTQTKPAQTTTKSVQTQTKPAQTTTKSTQTTKKTTPTGTKSTQTKSKTVQKGTTPATASKIKDVGTVRIGTQTWAISNLNVVTFRNGDTIREARTNKEWVAAGESGKPAWCHYNNDPANGPKYGKLYNWYAVNDPRGLAPAGWSLPGDADWVKLVNYLGGQGVSGGKMKSPSGWIGGDNGTNESGFMGLPGGYRVENGTFLNLGSIGTWWSSTESKSLTALDFYLSLGRSLGRSSSPKQRGESVRCLRDYVNSK